jgi:tRNA pseudouridine55 synthase
MLGVVNLDKPVGPTSHDMVGLMRRLTGIRRIGHAGTLDPLASGVLPILVGAATRFSQELTAGHKRYEATIRLGARSATDDGEGPIQPVDGTLPDTAALRDGIRGFVGTFAQRPPAFSARKQGGRTAHRAARSGSALELPLRTVTVESIEILDVTPGEGWLDVSVDIRCGAGTYIRSIARDLGDALGCGGYLRGLRRTEAAGLRVEEAVTPERLEALADEGMLADAVLPVGRLLPLPAIRLGSDDAWRFRHGLRLATHETVGGRVAVFDGDRLIGVGSLDGGSLRPEKVLPEENGS